MTQRGEKQPKHGLRGLMSRISVRGLGALDKRSAGYRAMVEWRNELERDLGGADALSGQIKALIETACRTRLLLDSIDAWLLAQPSVIDKRRRAALPILRERMSIAESLTRVLGQLGLDRVEKPVTGLEGLIERVRPVRDVETDPDGELPKGKDE